MALRILSIDGGGTRGIIPATILDKIHQDFGKLPTDLFDIFAGTSTGGIICIGLAAGLAPSDMVDLYLNNAAEIFAKPFLNVVTGLGGNIKAQYSNANLQSILTGLFGNKTLGQVQSDPNFGGQGKDLMVTSFDLSPDEVPGRNNNYRPALFHSSFICNKDILLTDLALRTSAGPTYFPVYQSRYIDGGVALNNPAMAAIAFAINDQQDTTMTSMFPDGARKGYGAQLKDLQVFSLSTGTGNKNRIEQATVGAGNWGNLDWIKYLPDLLTESNIQGTSYYVTQVLPDPDSQLYRIELYFDDATAPDILQSQSVGMDVKDPAILQAMQQFAVNTYTTQKDEIAAFLGL